MRLRTCAATAALGIAAGWLAGCTGGPAYTGPIRPGAYDIDEVVRANPIGDAPFGVVEIHRGPHASLHVVQVAYGIPMQRHDEADETMVIWRGAGKVTIGTSSQLVRAGMVIHIPAGVEHSFKLTSSEPAIAVSTFTPGFREGDRVLVR